MKAIKVGAVKYRSVAAAVKAAQKKHPELSYITIYMRLRAGNAAGRAIQVKPRAYTRRSVVSDDAMHASLDTGAATATATAAATATA